MGGRRARRRRREGSRSRQVEVAEYNGALAWPESGLQSTAAALSKYMCVPLLAPESFCCALLVVVQELNRVLCEKLEEKMKVRCRHSWGERDS